MDTPVIILTFFPGECKIYQDIFQDFLTKSIRFLFVSRFFPENHFTAAGMCRKGLPPPLWNPLPSHAGLLILSQDKPVKYELHHWIHAKCRMTFLGQECNQCLRIFCDGLITDHIGKVVDTVQLFCCFIQFLCNLLLDRKSNV